MGIIPWILPLYLFSILSVVIGIYNGTVIQLEPRIHDRPVVFVNIHYGGIQEKDVRHSMGVLIHSQFLITAGWVFSRAGRDAKSFQLRIGSMWAFQFGQIKEVDWWRAITPESVIEDDRFNVFLVRLIMPFYGLHGSCNLAFMEMNGYGIKAGTNRRIAGFHGALGRNWENHVLNVMFVKEIFPYFCRKFYTGMDPHVNEDRGDQRILFCGAEANSNDETDYATDIVPGWYDDGAPMMETNTNKVLCLVLAKVPYRDFERPLLLTYVQRYHWKILRHLRQNLLDEYRAFPDPTFKPR